MEHSEGARGSQLCGRRTSGYLPHTLTPAQVPEARALIPVMREDKQQGTIIVSVTDDVFDVSNRAHVKVANDIEIRLADQDLLPRFVDL